VAEVDACTLVIVDDAALAADQLGEPDRGGIGRFNPLTPTLSPSGEREPTELVAVSRVKLSDT